MAEFQQATLEWHAVARQGTRGSGLCDQETALGQPLPSAYDHLRVGQGCVPPSASLGAGRIGCGLAKAGHRPHPKLRQNEA